MRPLLTALQFLTRLPLRRFRPTADELRRAPYWFGAVGLGLGAVLAGAERLLRPWIPAAPALVLVLCLNAVLTGALHLDGLADTLDGLGGGDRARALAIMRDSRIGTYGVLGLLALFGLQFSALSALAPRMLTRALLLAPAWGRAALVLSAACSQPARTDGLGAAFLGSVRWRHALAAFAPPAAAAVCLRGGASAAAGAAALILAVSLAAAFRRRFGGQTGDTLGCVNEVVETATYWLALGIR